MKKLLDIDQAMLTSGRTRSKWMNTGGIWTEAQGFNPYIKNDTFRGLLAATAAPTDKTGSVIVDIPVAHVRQEDGSAVALYILGASGHLYSMTVNESLSDLRAATPITSPANGVAIMKPLGGSSTLLYARETRIGTWDLSGTYPTGWNDTAFATDIQTTPHHPMHQFGRIVYYGNKNYVGYLYDNGSSAIASQAKALTLDPIETCTAITDDGHYVIVGASHPVNEAYGANSSCRVLFWNGGTDEVVWQTRIDNESSIRGMWNNGNTTYVVGSRAVYTVSIGQTTAKPIYRFDTDEAIPYDGQTYGNVGAIAPFEDGIIFGALGTALTEAEPGTKFKAYNPLRGITGNISLIVPDFLEGKMHIGTRSSKFYSFALGSAGVSSQGDSRYFDLGGPAHVQRLEIELPTGLGPSDQIDITLYGNNGQVAVVLPSIAQSVYGLTYYLRVPLPKQLTTARVRVTLTLTAGTPAIGRISLWGEPATA